MTNKQQWRERLGRAWAELWPGAGAGSELRPPLFPGVNQAAERLRRLAVYRRARALAVLPDPALLQVRVNALQDGKTLIAVTPGFKQGFVRFTAAELPPPRRSRELTGGALFKAGRPIRLPQGRLGKVDLLVGSALAVDSSGVVLGDGRGMLDLAYALLRATGAMGPETPVAVLCHDQQVVEDLPRDGWDVGADLVVTPTRAIRPGQAMHPAPALDTLPPRLARLPVVQAVRASATPWDPPQDS